MLITKIILHKFKRFALMGEETFTLTISKKLNIFLGSNGCGKSSLLSELTPLPGDKTKFLDGGYKKIYVSHNNKDYILTSSFGKSNKYTFEEVGKASVTCTLTLHKHMVQDTFGLTKTIHELMIGTTSLTRMSLLERKKWFTELLSEDFSYVVGMYNALRDRRRDLVSYSKTVNELIMDDLKIEHADKDNDSDKQEIIKTCNMFLNHLVQYKGTYTPATTTLESNQLSMTELLKQLKEATSVPGYNMSIDSLNTAAIKYTELIKQADRNKKNINDTLNKLYNMKMDADNSRIVNSQDKDRLIEITAIIEDYKRKSLLEIPLATIDTVRQSYGLLEDRLARLFDELPNDPNNTYNKLKFKDLSEMVLVVNSEMNKNSKKINDYNNFIMIQEELFASENITCPECAHTWKNGVDIVKYEKVKKDLEILNSKQRELNTHKEEMTTTIAVIENKYKLFVEYKDIRQSTVGMEAVWDYIESNIDILAGANNYTTVFNKLNVMLTDLSDLNKLINEQESIRNRLRTSTNITENQITIARIEDNENILNSIITSRGEYVSQLEAVKKYISATTMVRNLKTLLKTELMTREDIYLTESTNIRRAAVDDLITVINDTLTKTEVSMSGTRARANRLETNKGIADTLNEKIEMLDGMIASLCPKTGLIGKTVLPKINNIITAINDRIKSVWSYPMEIQLYNLSEDAVDIDYKLPLIVNNETLIPDVKNTSSSMQEIVDLAYRLVVIEMMGLDMSLYLDEFGKSMDTEHRTKVYQLISDSLKYSPYSQVFVVSHFESAYGSLTDADITVISEDNIDIPSDMVFNQGLELT